MNTWETDMRNNKYEKEIFTNCIDTIIRQVSTINRMVNDFSTFAEMPRPIFQLINMTTIIKGSVSMTKLANKNLCDWHNLSMKLTSKNRNLKINTYEEKIFFNNLYRIGYLTIDKDRYKNNKINLIKAFQRRFRQDLVNGKIDQECLLISKSLVK